MINRLLGVSIILSILTLSVSLSWSDAALAEEVVYACVKQNGRTRIVADPSQCKANESPISWEKEGIQGPPGDKGATGPIGNKGRTGSTGDKGATGPTGDKGATGPEGDKGQTGPGGDKGPIGPAGDKGATGPEGDKGLSDSPGLSGLSVETRTEVGSVSAGQFREQQSMACCEEEGQVVISGGCKYTPEVIAEDSLFGWITFIPWTAVTSEPSCWVCNFVFLKRESRAATVNYEATSYAVCANLDFVD